MTTTWPILECLKIEQVIALIEFQWEHFGMKLDLKVEATEEIQPVRKRPKEKVLVK